MSPCERKRLKKKKKDFLRLGREALADTKKIRPPPPCSCFFLGRHVPGWHQRASTRAGNRVSAVGRCPRINQDGAARLSVVTVHGRPAHLVDTKGLRCRVCSKTPVCDICARVLVIVSFGFGQQVLATCIIHVVQVVPYTLSRQPHKSSLLPKCVLE